HADLGTVAQEGHQGLVVEVARAHVITDLHANVAGSQGPFRFAAGEVDVLQRYLGHGFEPGRCVGTVLDGQVVHAGGPLGCGRGRVGVTEHHRCSAQDLQVYAVLIHTGDASCWVPER